MKNKKVTPLILFILGFGLFMFTRYSTFLPGIHSMILIAPIFILRFIRTQPTKRGIWLSLLGFLLSFNIALWGLFEFDNPTQTAYFGLVRSSSLAIVWFIPFMVDRLIYPKFKNKGILSTLTLPIITTALLFLITFDGPFDDGSGTTNSFGFCYNSLVFSQIRSVFGIWILIFVHSWLYSIVNYFWDNKFHWSKIKKLLMIYTSILLIIVLFGKVKMSFSSSTESETVKIATIVLIPEDIEAVPMSRVFNSRTTSPFNKTVEKIQYLTKIASENGAKIVSTQEFAMTINQEDEEKLREEFNSIAEKNNVYLSISYAYFVREGKGENKHLFIDNKGNILLDYSKRYLLGFGPFGESAVFHKGAEIIQSTDTPYGKIGISVCRDAGFPKYMRQAAKSKVDIMLSPSYDWPKSQSPWYITSAVENGFSFVRPTYNGYSYAADYNGNVLAHMVFDKTNDGIMYADVPIHGLKTFYPLFGDLLGWLCVLSMFGLIVFPLKLRKKEKLQ